VDIIIQPTDTFGSGTVRIDFDEDGNPYFRSNVQDITLDFISDTAVHSEVRLNPNLYGLEDVTEKEGAYWSMPFVLNEGLNEINIRSRNEEGDMWEENVLIYIKTSLPGLLLDDIRCEDGKVKVTGFTDRPGEDLDSSEPAVRVYINGEETGVDEDGGFSHEFDAPDKALIDVSLRLVDSFGNENIHNEKVINDSIGQISGIAIDISDIMNIGEIVRLKATAYQLDEQGNRTGEFELPDELIRWEIIEGGGKADIRGNWLEAFAKGQIVLSAAYDISDDYTWYDYMVVDISVPEGGQITQEEAYLTGIETSFGELSPAFDRHTYHYNVTVPYNLGSMWLKPVTDLEDAIITVNGEQLAAGEKTGQIPLSTGNNTITITVTSPGKLTGVYTVNVFREEEGRKPTPVESEPDLPASGLTDISGHWAEEAIKYLVNAGIITGYTDNTFRPDRNISRAEFVTLLVRALGLSGDTQKLFDDTREHWARENIAIAYANGIVEGHSEHHFGPDDTATRKQMATMLVRALKLEQTQVSLDFADTADISSWALPYVSTAVKEGIFQGYTDNTFRPKRNATRAETATVLYRILEQ